MRFCPFCSAENADELAVCQACGRRLPPLPPRRAGSKGPPTGITLPPRAGATAPPPIPRRAGATVPPPIPSNAPAADPVTSVVTKPVDKATPAPKPADLPTPVVSRDSAPSLPPPPDPRQGLLDALTPGPAAERKSVPPDAPSSDGPTRRRTDVSAEDATSRRRTEVSGDDGATQVEAEPYTDAPTRARRPSGAPLSPTAFSRPGTSSQPPPIANPAPRSSSPSQPPPMRSSSPSQPPPMRSSSPSQPPPMRSSSPSQPPPMRAHRPSAPPPLPRTTVDVDRTPVTAPPIEALRPRGPNEPPPTRIGRSDATDRPFTPPKVLPVPEIPEPGLIHAARYAYTFWRARWQRRGAIRQLGVEIKQDTEALDQVLGALGRAARAVRVEGRVFSAENAAISQAEERIAGLQQEAGEAEGRKTEENSKFIDIERERTTKLSEAERQVEEAQRELTHLEAQRRAARDKRKDLERRQKAHLKAADDHERQAVAAQMGDQRTQLRVAAEGHRKEAAALEPERQELDRNLASLERPIGEATAKLDAGKAELDAAKRSLNDAREGHTHRLAELDAEQKRKSREVALAEGEIQRRLVTLGTLVNLNRIEDPSFVELYERIDRLRGAITARTTEIEKLTAEREAYDRGTLVRGVATIGGAFVALIALIVIFRAIL
jgi:hypothetical protein